MSTLPTRDAAERHLDQRESLLSKIDRALEDVDRLTPLDDARFLETHTTFEAHSDQRELIIAWLRRHHNALETPAGSLLRVLSIGSGDGSVDLPAARALATNAGRTHYVGVDPNQAELAQLERTFAKADLPGLTLETHGLPFDHFEEAGHFDLIQCVHSFYYMPNPIAALQRALGMLADDGQLVFFHAPREDLNSLATRFYDKHYGRETPFAQDFANLLDDSPVTYERERIDARIDVTSMFAEQHEVGVALRDFILQFDSRALPPAVIAPVKRYLRLIAEVTCSAASIAHPVDVFVIRRQADAPAETS